MERMTQTLLLNMENNIVDYSEITHDVRLTLEREREKLMERAEQLDAHLRVVDAIEKLQKENHCLKDENEELLQQLNDEKQRTAELEMKLIEMSRLTTGMARKASEDNLLKALRTYVNRSKRKTADKRSFAKSAILEIANANGLDLPEDLKDAIESLDDAEAETAVSVNAQKGSIVQVTSEGINNNNLLRAE